MRNFFMNKLPEFCDFGVVDDLTKVVCKYPHNHISSFYLTIKRIYKVDKYQKLITKYYYKRCIYRNGVYKTAVESIADFTKKFY